MTAYSVYSAVRGDNDRRRLEAYLYDHTTCVVQLSVEKLSVYVLRTTSVGHDEAKRLARYQVDRLSSGLYGVDERLFNASRPYIAILVGDWVEQELKHRLSLVETPSV